MWHQGAGENKNILNQRMNLMPRWVTRWRLWRAGGNGRPLPRTAYRDRHFDERSVRVHIGMDTLTGKRTRTLTRSRDNLRRPTGFVLGNEHAVGYGYDVSGRLATLSAQGLPNLPGKTHAFEFTYELGSSLLDKVTGPVHEVDNDYEPHRDVLLQKTNTRTVGTPGELSIIGYTVNEIGQRVQRNLSGEIRAEFYGGQAADLYPTDWGYDALGQVTSEDKPSTSADRGFSYDLIGNRLTSTADGVTTTYTPNQLNQYTAITGSPTLSPQYDPDGNMTSGLLNGSTTGQFEYNGANQLIRTQATATSNPTHYAYDAFGRRIAKVTYPNGGGAATSAAVFLYDGWNIIAEYKLISGAWTLDRTYTWGLDLSGSTQGAGGVGGLLSVTKHEAQSTTHFYPIYDGNGNVEAYIDSNGSPAAIYQYDAFGNVLSGGGKGDVLDQAKFSHRFSTKYQEYETGLLYYGYRYYHAALGRWINRDPIEERGGLNLYGFVGNSSLLNFDVVGLQGFPGVPPNLNTNGQVTDWALGNYKPHHPPMPPPAKFDDSWPEECPGGQMEVLVYDNFPLDIVIPALFGENSTNPFGKLALSCCCERLVGIALQINDDKDRNIMQNQLGIQRNAMFGMLALRNGGVHVRIGPDIIIHKGIIFAGVLGRFSDLKIDANGNLLSSDGTLRPDLPFVDEAEKFRATLRDKLAEHKEELNKIVAAYPSVLRKIDEFTDACKNRGLKK